MAAAPKFAYAPKVPAEFLGKARAFRAKLAAGEVEFSRTRDAALNELRDRMVRKPTFRRDDCIDLMRRYRAGRQQFGQTDDAEFSYDKKRVEVTDIRLVSVTKRREDWDQGEPGVVLTILRLIADRKVGLRQGVLGVATFGLHALARFISGRSMPTNRRY